MQDIDSREDDPNSTEDGIELATEMVINACGGN